jgi:hypothetical protein
MGFVVLSLENAFDGIPISIASHLKSDPKSLHSGFEVVRSVNEKRGLLNLLFLAEFAEKQHGELRSSRLKQSDVHEFVVSGSTAPYSQCRSLLIRITVSSSAI